MRVPKREWVTELQSRFGAQVKLSWNETVGRWQFDVLTVAMEYKPQFLQWERDPKTGQKLKEDQFGLLPFRDLDDATFREVCRNLERTYLAAPGAAQTVQGHVQQVRQHNARLQERTDRHNREEGRLFFKGEHRRLTGGAFSAGGIEVVSPIGTKEA